MSVETRDLSSILRPYRDRSTNYGAPDMPLSNHLPMAVTALAAMGAGDERLTAWAAGYDTQQQLRPASLLEQQGRDTWRTRIAGDGTRTTLARALATLANGFGAAAFHAAIRAAYALERGDDDDLASALESWEREFVELPVAVTRERVSASEALAALATAPVDRSDPGQWLIADAMRTIGKRDGFAALAMVVPSTNAVDDLAIAAAGAFAATGSFTALHLMTGTHALRVLMPYAADPDPLMPGFWSAYAAAAIGVGVPPAMPERALAARPGESLDWNALVSRAAAQDDDHVVKATYTAWRLHAEIGRPIFGTAAERYLAAHSR